MIPRKLLRSGDNAEFTNIPPCYFNAGNTFHSHECGPDLIEGDIPEVDKAEGIRGEAVPEYREHGDLHLLGLHSRRRRQGAADVGDAALHELERLLDIAPPVEIHGDFRRSAPGDGADDPYTRN